MKEFTDDEIDNILKTMQAPTLTQERKIPLRSPISKVEFEKLQKTTPSKEIEKSDFNQLKVKIEVVYGSKTLILKDLVNIQEGDHIALDQQAETPVEIYANGRKVGVGEIVEVDGHFGVKVLHFED